MGGTGYEPRKNKFTAHTSTMAAPVDAKQLLGELHALAATGWVGVPASEHNALLVAMVDALRARPLDESPPLLGATFGTAHAACLKDGSVAR